MCVGEGGGERVHGWYAEGRGGHVPEPTQLPAGQSTIPNIMKVGLSLSTGGGSKVAGARSDFASPLAGFTGDARQANGDGWRGGYSSVISKSKPKRDVVETEAITNSEPTTTRTRTRNPTPPTGPLSHPLTGPAYPPLHRPPHYPPSMSSGPSGTGARPPLMHSTGSSDTNTHTACAGRCGGGRGGGGGRGRGA